MAQPNLLERIYGQPADLFFFRFRQTTAICRRAGLTRGSTIFSVPEKALRIVIPWRP